MSKLLVYMSAEDLARLGGLVYAGRSVVIEGFVESSLLLQLSAFTSRVPVVLEEDEVVEEEDVLPIYPNASAGLLERLLKVEGWVATVRRLGSEPNVPVYRLASREWLNAPPPLKFFVEVVRLASKTSSFENVVRGLIGLVRAKAEAVRLMMEAGVKASEALRRVSPSEEELPVVLLTLKREHGLSIPKEEVAGALRGG
ncbi:MAG: hypothetical protein QXZ24_05230 [Candidatus Jordarchaeales archaeon]